MSKDVLLINDLAGYGKVALSAMIPVLSRMGLCVHNLPTAVVSNTLDYGSFEILDTTDYMRKTIEVWKGLGFGFDAISTGFLVNREQAELVASLCREQSARGVAVFCDPIMGDDGHLYPGLGADTVEFMREMVPCADYLLPNYTEAALLTGRSWEENPTEAELRAVIDALRDLGAKSVILTSAVMDGRHLVYGYDHRQERYFAVPFSYIPVRFPGTGDLFASVLLGSVVQGRSLEESVARAVGTVHDMIEANLSNEDKLRGINLETCLEAMDR